MTRYKKRKKRRNPIIDFMLAGAVIALTAAVVFFIVSGNDSKKTKEPELAASDISKENSTFEGIRIVADVSNDPKIPFALHYPETDSSEFNKKVLSYVKSAKKEFLAAMDNETEDNELGELNITLETYPHKDNFYSFVLAKTMSTNSADEKTTYKTFLYDKEQAKAVNIATLLDNNTDALELLADNVQTNLSDNEELKNALIADKVETLTAPKWENFERFSIEDDALKFYFNDYELTASANDTPTVSIPLSFVDPILAERFQAGEVAATNILTPKPRELDPNGKYVALTFDDGPDPNSTKQILDLLDKYNAKATFFLLGNRVQYYPEMVQEEFKRGHEIGNHSWSHPQLTKLNVEQVQQEVNRTDDAIKAAIGQPSSVFRPPYGAINDTVRAQIPTPVELWSIDTLDWKHKNASMLLPAVQNAMHNRAVILMHDIHQSTADGLDSVLAYLQGQGYEFITVSEMNALPKATN